MSARERIDVGISLTAKVTPEASMQSAGHLVAPVRRVEDDLSKIEGATRSQHLFLGASLWACVDFHISSTGQQEESIRFVQLTVRMQLAP